MSPALLATGNEEYLRARTISTYLAPHLEADPDLRLTEVEAATLTPAAVHESLGPNLFGGTPGLHILNGNQLSPDTLNAVLTYVTDPGCLLVVDIPKPADAGGKNVIATLTKHGATHEKVEPPRNIQDRRQFVQSELRAARIAPTGDLVNILADGGADYRGVVTRIQQLISDHDHPTRLDATDAAQVVSSSTANGFAVADAMLTRNPTTLTHATREALAANTAHLLIQTACLMALRDLAALTTGSTTKMPPWKAKKMRPHLRQWNQDAITRAVHELGVLGETFRSSAHSDQAFLATLLRTIA